MIYMNYQNDQFLEVCCMAQCTQYSVHCITYIVQCSVHYTICPDHGSLMSKCTKTGLTSVLSAEMHHPKEVS